MQCTLFIMARNSRDTHEQNSFLQQYVVKVYGPFDLTIKFRVLINLLEKPFLRLDLKPDPLSRLELKLSSGTSRALGVGNGDAK